MAGQSIKPVLYTSHCPEGSWTARLDEKTDRATSDFRLFFTDISNGKKYLLQEFLPDQCKFDDPGFDFQSDAFPGDIFVLITEKAEGGKFILVSARRILQKSGEDQNLFDFDVGEKQGIVNKHLVG